MANQDLNAGDWHCIQEIRSLIKRFGWRVFIQSLAAYAERTASGLAAFGLAQEAGQWQKVYEKVSKLRKNLSSLIS